MTRDYRTLPERSTKELIVLASHLAVTIFRPVDLRTRMAGRVLPS